jgi:hypothetical protein
MVHIQTESRALLMSYSAELLFTLETDDYLNLVVVAKPDGATLGQRTVRKNDSTRNLDHLCLNK